MNAEHDAAGVTFGLLGPVAAWRDGLPVVLGGTKARVLLAVLLTNRRRVTSVVQLVDALWGPAPPRSATKMVQVLVSQLRRAFGPERAGLIRTVDGGYVLDCEDDAFDVARARASCADGKHQLTRSPDRASECFRAGLEIWRGEPLCDIAREPFAAARIAELDELHHELIGGRIAAELALGRHAELVGELRAHAAADPARESIHADLMLALYRSGRQIDALDVARRAKARLAEDFGVDAGRAIGDLEQRILRHDPTLGLPAPATPLRAAIRTPDPPAKAYAIAVPPSLGGGPSRRHRRRRRALLGGIVVAVAVTGTVLFALTGGTDAAPATRTHALAGDSVAVFDAVSGDLRADVPVGGYPGPVVVAGGSVWVCDRNDKTLTKIDSSSFVTRDVIGLTQSPQHVTATSGQVWVSLGVSGQVARIDTTTDQITSAFYPARPIQGFLDLTGTPSAVWIGTSDTRVLRMSARDATVTTQTQLPRRSEQIAASPTAAWTATEAGIVYQITPGRRPVALVDLHGSPAAMVAAYGSVWVATTAAVLIRLDPTSGHISARYALNGPPTSIAAGAGAVWVAENPGGVLERIPVARDAPRTTYELGYPIGGLAVSGTSVWVTLDQR